MNKILLLLKYYLKLPKTKSRIQIPTPLKYAIFALAMLLISIAYAGAVSGAYGVLAKIGEQRVLLEMILISGSIITLIIGFFNVINTFFLAEDVDVFLPLPFKASEIVFSKVLSTLAYLYVYSLIIVIPLLAYGTAANAGGLYYVYVVCAYIFNPIIPMIFAFIISSFLMKLGNLGKHKDALKIVFTVVMIVIVVAINVFFKGNDVGKQAANIAIDKATFIKIVSLIFINIKFESAALLGYAKAGAILNILAVLLISIVLVGILYFVSEKMYLKSIKASTDVAGDSKKRKVVIRETSILKALVIKEFKVVFRTPVFLINSVVMLFYIPVLYIFIIFSNSLGSKYWHYGFVVLGATTLAVGLGMSSGSAASTALSREGNNILVSKYIPISYKTQMLAKIITGFLINSLIVLLGIGILVFEKVRPEILILSIIIQILTCLLMSVIGVLTDYLRPRVSWETEKSLYKGNFRNLGNLVISAILGGVVLAVAFAIKNVLIIFVINALILIVATAGILIILNKIAVRTYKSI